MVPIAKSPLVSHWNTTLSPLLTVLTIFTEKLAQVSPIQGSSCRGVRFTYSSIQSGASADIHWSITAYDLANPARCHDSGALNNGCEEKGNDGSVELHSDC